jgi:hypothetical protein
MPENSDKFVVVFDLFHYGIISSLLVELAGDEAVKQFNDRLHELALKALELIGVTVRVPYRSTGDGAIVALDSAQEAHSFANALHELAHMHNLGKKNDLARLHFRIGIAKGHLTVTLPKVVQHSIDPDMVGIAITDATRLQAACHTGEVLISEKVWSDLKPDELRNLYGEVETIRDKHDQPYKVYRRKVVEQAPAPQYPPGIALPVTGPAAVLVSPIGRAYIEALRFGKLVHHQFQTLDTMGLRAFERAARTIFKGALEPELSDLIAHCQDEWAKSRDARNEIDQEILQKLTTLIPKINVAFTAIVTDADRETERPISSSLAQLDPIKDDIAAYKVALTSISTHDNPPDGFSASDPSLRSFASQAMALSRIVDRLVAKADALITNLLDAMEIDPRLKPIEQVARKS